MKKLRPDLVIIDDPVYEDSDKLLPIEKVFESLQPYQKELIVSFDYGATETRLLVLMGSFNSGMKTFTKLAERLKYNLVIADEGMKSFTKFTKDERRYAIIEKEELPRLDRPHYRTLEKKNKKRSKK